MDTPLQLISFSDLIFSNMWYMIYFTVPFLIIFIITVLVYFLFIDKHKSTIYDPKTQKKDKDASAMPGRRLMMLFFILFFMVLLSIIIQFSTAYIIEYDSMRMRGAANNEFYPIPFNILINAITACTMLFIGVEGSVASISTFQLAKGQMIKLPALKRSRVYAIVYLWMFTTIVAVTYHFILGTNIIDFKLDELFIGLSTAIVLLFASDKAPNVFKNFGKDGLNVEQKTRINQTNNHVNPNTKPNNYNGNISNPSIQQVNRRPVSPSDASGQRNLETVTTSTVAIDPINNLGK